MADIYLYHTGSNTSPYDTWAKAATTFNTALSAAAAGDTIYVSGSHAEDLTANITPTSAGTTAAPVRIICSDHTSGEPPTTLADTASISMVTGYDIALKGSFYMYGITFNIGNNGSGAILSLGNEDERGQTFEKCQFLFGSGSNNTSQLQISLNSTSYNTHVVWRDCNLSFNHVNQRLVMNNASLSWEGGSIVSGSTAPAYLVIFIGSALFTASGVDLSNLGTTTDLINTPIGSGKALFRNCKLPASWTGLPLVSAPTFQGFRAELYNCDSGDTNYRVYTSDLAGTVTVDTGIYRDSGASDGTTQLSWKMATGADADDHLNVLVSPEIVQWNDTTGTSKTVTVEIVHDGATAFTDRDIWLEVMYLGTTRYPLGSWISERASLLASGTAQTTSSETWTGDTGTGPNGSATWNTLKLVSPSFTPQEKGYIHARVCMGIASKTVYVDPLLTVA